jgi:5'-nucleotidase / UDP-sugar diphosphatase
MIVQSGSNLKYVGKTTLTIENGYVKTRRDEIIPLSTLKKGRQEMELQVNKYNQNEAFSKVVGVAAEPMEGLDELGSLMTDALKDELKVDFAFQNKGGIRVQSMSQGDITLKDIYKLDPFNNQVVIFNMNASEIKSLICYGYKLEKGIDLQVSGMTYTVTDNGKNECASVEMLDANGKPLDDKKEYLVAMNNYMAVTYQFDHHDAGTTSSITTAEALVNYLKTKKVIHYHGVKRAK